MGRLALLSSLLLGTGLTACSSFRDLFSAHADVAAEAGEHRLTPERLTEIMSSGKGIRPNRDAANFVTNVWIDSPRRWPTASCPSIPPASPRRSGLS